MCMHSNIHLKQECIYGYDIFYLLSDVSTRHASWLRWIFSNVGSLFLVKGAVVVDGDVDSVIVVCDCAGVFGFGFVEVREGGLACYVVFAPKVFLSVRGEVDG